MGVSFSATRPADEAGDASQGHHACPNMAGVTMRQVLLGCYFRGLIGMQRDKDSQRGANGPLGVTTI
jgi:hypothetical protein